MSEPTVAYRLFHDTFMVQVQNKFLWTPQHMRRVPGMSSQDNDVTQQLLNETSTVARTAIGIILLYDKGIIAELTNRHDIYTIHDLITRHLNRWGEIIANPISGRTPPPAEDLYKMDAYANFISADADFHREALAAMGHVTDKSDFISQLLSTFGGNQRHNLALIRQIDPLTQTEQQYIPAPMKNNIQDAWNNSAWGLLSGNSRHSR
jgi:hypothetical protein